ncbi:sensor histidine kinase [Phosphitispora sp. TUW77]|uniref:sensor histidine kinase n=1 Tax=Phosphitispora sp. TUW77 TaxID=3152361 RepID=UPI003AB1745B
MKFSMGQIISKFLISIWTRLFNHYQHSNAIKLLYSYRYGSLLITSAFYLCQGSFSLLPYKLAVVVSLYVAARLITDMYVRHLCCAGKLRAIILLETLVITLLLVPTGGLDSPFMWYALNPVLVAAVYLSPWFCWVNLFLYMVTAGGVSAGLFNKGQAMDLFFEYSYLMLVFILITLLVRLLAEFLKSLSIANSKQQESLEHIMSLYQIVETFTNEDHLETFFQIFTDYAAKLSKTGLAFFWENTDKFNNGQIYTNTDIDKDLKCSLCKELKVRIQGIGGAVPELNLNLAKSTFHAIPVRTSTKLYGVLGIQLEQQNKNSEMFLERQLFFLSDLSAIILERFSMEEANDKLMILEERNRIANEIHDSVSQRLFSITYALYKLKNGWDNLEQKEIREHLERLGESANTAMHELRQSIYSMSTQKSAEKIFFSGIKKYLSDLAHLNDIDICMHLGGNEELLPARLKKCLYRIICEATGNAVKHGRSSNIKVLLDVNTEVTVLLIEDNGIGFEPDKIHIQDMGLGLANIKNTVQSFGGMFFVNSKSGLGTRVRVEIPSVQFNLHKQGGIA